MVVCKCEPSAGLCRKQWRYDWVSSTCHYTVWLWLLSENGTYFCSFSRNTGMSQHRQAHRRWEESCGVQGCWKKVNSCSGSPAIIKNVVLLVQMILPTPPFPPQSLLDSLFAFFFFQSCSVLTVYVTVVNDNQTRGVA